MFLKAVKVFREKYEVTLLEDSKTLVSRWKKHKSEMARRGGFAHFKKYGSPATPEGRRKGGSKALAILRQRGVIPGVKSYILPRGFSSELAEFVGILLGDGGITSGQACITLNREADCEYVKFVVGLGDKLFGEKPRLLPRKDSKAIGIYYNGVSFVNYLVEIGLKIGNKVRQQVGVPDWVRLSNVYRVCCLRGLMDTDGGVFLHKYKVAEKFISTKKSVFLIVLCRYLILLAKHWQS